MAWALPQFTETFTQESSGLFSALLGGTNFGQYSQVMPRRAT